MFPVLACCFGLSLAVRAQHLVEPYGLHCDSEGQAPTAYVAGINCRTTTVDGISRHYIVYKPTSPLPLVSPVVIMLHGGSSNAKESFQRSGWREKASREGFIAVFPTAAEHFVLDQSRWSTVWNNYNQPHEIDTYQRPLGATVWPADDVKFVDNILNDLESSLGIDAKRIFVTGFSSGGGQCARLGVELSSRIAATACHGAFNEVHKTLAGQRNLSMLYTIGNEDGKLLDEINALPPNSLPSGLGGQPLASLPLDPALLVQVPLLNGRVDALLESLNLQEALGITTTDPNWVEMVYQSPGPGNSDNNELIVGVLKGVKHHYPSGDVIPANPHGFNLPNRAWQFFQSHPMP